MEPDAGRSWIERDPNGRLIHVRKRTILPSTRSMLAEVFSGTSNNPFARTRSRSRSFPRAKSKRYLSAPVLVRTPTPLALPAPLPLPPTAITAPGAAMNTTPESGSAFVHDTGQYSQPPLLNDPTQQLPYRQYPSYIPSYTTYYLAPNPAPPSFQDPYAPPPPGARILSPPRAATADELKYKCSICGRFRSPRFHYKHPIPPGQLPAPTVCRKCRQTGTDSEDSSEVKADVRGFTRSRSVVSISEPIRARVVSDGDGGLLRRSPRRVSFVPTPRSRHRGRLRRRSTSSSSSLDLDAVDILEENHPRRTRSRSVRRVVERIRYVDDSPPLRVSPACETIYIEDIEDWRRRRDSKYGEERYAEYDSDEDYIPTRRISSRPASRIRVARRQYSEPVVREHVRSTTRDYFDGPNSVYEESAIVEGPARPSPKLISDFHMLRVSRDEARSIRERLANSDEYELVADRSILKDPHGDNDWYEDDSRSSGRERRSRRRSRSRLSTNRYLNNGKSKAVPSIPTVDYCYGNSRSPDYARAPHALSNTRAPTPPLADHGRSTRQSIRAREQDKDEELRYSRHHEPLDGHGRPVVGRRRMGSRARSRSGSGWSAPFGGRPPSIASERTEIQERIQERPSATEDYDWYDSHGQRVRVREI